ncbi:pTS system [Clostridium sp. CAG:265]|nr:pTS system [Clostridium sp. CAG:265]
MGVFVGIISGFLGAVIYNKYYNYNKLPQALNFFNSKRFVPFVVILWSTVTALVLSVIWPFAQGALNSFGMWLANSKDTAPVLAPFIYGCLERLLLPFGLHHMLTIPVNYTELGGVYTALTGASAGVTIAGQDPLWFAWITDLINLKGAGDMTTYNNIISTVVPARFKAGQVVLSTVLYVVYAVITGLGFTIAGLINLRVHSFGAIELFTRIPMLVKAGLTSDIINFVIVCAVFFVLNYGVFTFCIKKFKIPTPGRLGNYDEEETSVQKEAAVTSNNIQALNIIELLGNKDNIEDVDACMTRLRVTVKNLDKVANEEKWKQNGALGLILKGNGVQAIYGPKADILKSDIQDIIGV